MELDENKLALSPQEDFEELCKGAKHKSVGTQTTQDLVEVELQKINGEYSGEISVEHFLASPSDLQSFITHYYKCIKK